MGRRGGGVFAALTGSAFRFGHVETIFRQKNKSSRIGASAGSRRGARHPCRPSLQLKKNTFENVKNMYKLQWKKIQVCLHMYIHETLICVVQLKFCAM
jgi:hypothetical protein